MKTICRFALVLALTFGAAACSSNITGPDWDAPEHNPTSDSHNPTSTSHNPTSTG